MNKSTKTQTKQKVYNYDFLSNIIIYILNKNITKNIHGYHNSYRRHICFVLLCNSNNDIL